MLLTNSQGGYSFLRGGSAYSAGVAASKGFSIEHARLRASLPWRKGFEGIDAHLRAIGRPRAALCAVALRCQAPFTFAGFKEFNAGYAELLKSWDVFVDGINPIARTNVAPEVNPPWEPSLYSFAYTVPDESAKASPSFVVAGAGEIPDGTADLNDVVRRGETSPDAVMEKAQFVLDLVQARLFGLGMTWNDVTTTNVYSILDVNSALNSKILPRIAGGGHHGVNWYYTRPPIESLEFEMDVRGCARELVVDLG